MASEEEGLYVNKKAVSDRKGKKKMFRLLNHKSEKPQNGYEFKFKLSNFQAFQVPKGWDKLFISIVSMETGNSIAKSGKALVRNGSCWWEEATLLEPIWISRDDASQDIQECLYKFVVAMGSVRFGTLGEANMNLSSYINSTTSNSVSLPLKKCEFNTILQVKIQCLNPRTRLRDEPWEYTSSYMEEMNVDYDDIDSKSDVSELAFTRSGRSSTNNHWDNTYPLDEPCREPSLLASDSHRSSDSPGGPFFEEKSSSRCVLDDLIGNQDSNGSQDCCCGSSYNVSFRKNNSSSRLKLSGSQSHLQHEAEDFGQVSSSTATMSLHNAASSKDLLDAAEATIELLKAEAKMWEQNTRKLMVDHEKLQTDLSEQSKEQEILKVELSNSRAEYVAMKQDVEQLKILLERERARQTENEDFIERNMSDNRKELENEIVFQKESNATLSLQLKKCMEANIELVSVLQELEGTIEEQKIEITELAMAKSQFEDVQLKQFHESQRNLESIIHSLEKTLEEKNREVEIKQDLMSGNIMELEAEWRDNILEKEQEIINLEAKLSEALEYSYHVRKIDFAVGSESSHVKEIEELRQNVQNLTKHCLELENETLKLQIKLNDHSCISECEVNKLKSRVQELEEDLKEKETHEKEVSNIQADLEHQLEVFKDKARCLENELCRIYENKEEKESVIAVLQQKLECYQERETDAKDYLPTICTKLKISYSEAANEMYILFYKLYEQLHNSIENLKNQQFTPYSTTEEDTECRCYSNSSEAEADLNNLVQLKKLFEATVTLCCEELQCSEKEVIIRLEQANKDQSELNHILKENTSCSFTRGLTSLHLRLTPEETNLNDKLFENLSKTKEFEAGKILLKDKNELEGHLSELQEDNVLLSERICGLEAVLRYMTDERESSRLALQNSECHSTSLQDEIRRMQNEMDSRKVVMKQRSEDLTKRWLEAQAECDLLKITNQKLHARSEKLIKERNLLPKSNEALRKQSMELQALCTVLEGDLRESQNLYYDVLKEVEALEAKVFSLVKGLAWKEKAMNSELEKFILESKDHLEKLIREKNWLNQLYLEPPVEVSNLQKEVSKLNDPNSAVHSEVYHMQMEAEMKVLVLIAELGASKQNQEILMIDHEKALQMLEDIKSNEDKLESAIRSLELKLQASEYEKLQLSEEISCLKIQVHKTEVLQEEVFDLKTLLCVTKSEKQRLEASFEILSGDYEEVKAKRIYYVQKITSMEKAMFELEDFKRSKVVLQEKVVQLEWDLTAREALNSQVTKLKKELAWIKRTNGEFQKRIKYLEEEKVEYVNKTEALEEELRQKIEVNLDQIESNRANLLFCHESETSKAFVYNNPSKQLLLEGDNNIVVNSSKMLIIEDQVHQLSNGQGMLEADLDQEEVDMHPKN